MPSHQQGQLRRQAGVQRRQASLEADWWWLNDIDHRLWDGIVVSTARQTLRRA